MSDRASAWVWKQRPDLDRPGQKASAHVKLLVLLVLAERSRNETGMCHPGVERIAADACLTVRAVQLALHELEIMRLVVVERRVGRTGKRDQSSFYRLPAVAFELPRKRPERGPDLFSDPPVDPPVDPFEALVMGERDSGGRVNPIHPHYVEPQIQNQEAQRQAPRRRAEGRPRCEHPLWGQGVAALAATTGWTRGKAEGFVGKLRKLAKGDDDLVLDIIGRVEAARPVQPWAFMQGCLRHQQQQVEARDNGFTEEPMDWSMSEGELA